MDSSIKRKNAKKKEKADRTINGPRFVDSSVDLRASVIIRKLEIARTITVRNMVQTQKKTRVFYKVCKLKPRCIREKK